MTHQIRRVATAIMVLFVALAINVNILQLVRGPDLIDNPANKRLLVAEYSIERGPILVGDQPIAESVGTDDDLEYLRVYDQPELYAHLTGYDSFVLGRSGLEAALNDQLIGAPSEMLAQNLTELLIGRDVRGNTVRLTIDPEVQEAARSALDGRVGAVVAIEPTTGRVLASYAIPTYDPNRLASHDAGEVLAAFEELRLDPAQPLLDRVTRVSYPPGSVFKLVVAAAALEQGYQPDSQFRNTASFVPDTTTVPIPNSNASTCGPADTISLADALRVSCNTVFARLAVELGADALVATAERLGFNRSIPYELPVASSVIPQELDVPALAQSGIGQRDVRMTPFHAAVMAATIANDGLAMRPHVVRDVLSPSGRVVQGSSAGVWREAGYPEQAISVRTARQLQDMMVAVVEDGTGTAAQIDDVVVGGKTGTAEDPNLDDSIAWFVGFAGQEVAVAVVLPDVEGGGGSVAAPVAREVMEAALR